MSMKMTVTEKCDACKKAALTLASSDGIRRNAVLRDASRLLLENSAEILEKNRLDLSRAEENGIKGAMVDRLSLSEERINDICSAINEIAHLPDPIGKGERWTLPNGLKVQRVSVPMGVIGIIYEARPNVTADAASLCIKSGNGVVLRGGKEAVNTGKAIAGLFRQAAEANMFSGDIVQFIDDISRDSATELMRAKGHLDLLIPRGGKGLIKSVAENALVPVIETGAGNCHIYAEKSCDIQMAINVIHNAKTSRPSVCNAVEHLLVDRDIAKTLLPALAEKLKTVSLRGGEEVKKILPKITVVPDDDFFTEYNDYILSIKLVGGIDEAISHINTHSTGHSEAILTSDLEKADKFTKNIDSAAVYVNASTRFTDGGVFGFGAEIGISTQKLHARGPMGLSSLTTVKYIVNGSGQVR